MSARPGNAAYRELAGLLEEFKDFAKPPMHDGVPDYSPPAMKRQRRELKQYMERLNAIDTRDWSVSRKVDWHVVRAQMNGLEFHHRGLRPWSRDPAFYVTAAIQFAPRMHGAIPPRRLTDPPKELDELASQLRAVPAILDQARDNLIEAGGDLTTLGVQLKKRESQLYAECARALAERGSGLAEAARQAQKATDDFRAWLEKNRTKMNGPSGIGVEEYDWHLKNVQLVPWDWREMTALATREYKRSVAFLKLEEHRNRKRPAQEPKMDDAAFQRLLRRARRDLWRYVNEDEILTAPDWMAPPPPKPGRRPSRPQKKPGNLDFFENILRRDPQPLICHEIIGHTPDGMRVARDRRPIRGEWPMYFVASFRSEGLATGIEEILMMAGMLDKRPRSRELTHILVAHRAARALSDLKMHSNEFSFDDAFQHNVDMTPYGFQKRDSRVMYGDVELYLRQPSYGTAYTLGAAQLQQLIADYALKVGRRFTLRGFMDRFLSLGVIPLSLARWEMTGETDEIERLTAP